MNLERLFPPDGDATVELAERRFLRELRRVSPALDQAFAQISDGIERDDGALAAEGSRRLLAVALQCREAANAFEYPSVRRVRVGGAQ